MAAKQDYNDLEVALRQLLLAEAAHTAAAEAWRNVQQLVDDEGRAPTELQQRSEQLARDLRAWLISALACYQAALAVVAPGSKEVVVSGR